MDENSTLTLKRYFKEYYFRYSERIKQPSDIESREFGYFPFGGGMIRHLGFREIGAFRALLVREAPAGVYCSNSHYHDPSAEMHKKGWMKAEPIFDIDADALKLPCKKDHDVWLCKQCGRKEFGLRPETCPGCNGNRLLEMSWACPLCLEGSKKETFRLLDFLEDDFGIESSQIKIYFSGNAGYHIEVSGSKLDGLDQHARSEISDYLTGQGVMSEIFQTPRLSPADPGWRGRIARWIRDMPPNSPPFKTSEFEKRLPEIMNDPKSEQMRKVFDLAVNASSVRIDVMVTTDIHRIFRMPETLNNKTGLVKRYCEDLSSFDPLSDAIALKDNDAEEIEVIVDMCPRIELGGESFGPFRCEKKKLPSYVAVYLIAKGAAKVVAAAPQSPVKFQTC
ncbi:MAG: DNA primase small subunit domain-containing protein [Nitrososphaerales archaeon]